MDLLKTPGKRRQRIVCASFGLLFTLFLILAIAGVFSKDSAAPVVDSSTGNNGDINVSRDPGSSSCQDMHSLALYSPLL